MTSLAIEFTVDTTGFEDALGKLGEYIEREGLPAIVTQTGYCPFIATGTLRPSFSTSRQTWLYFSGQSIIEGVARGFMDFGKSAQELAELIELWKLEACRYLWRRYAVLLTLFIALIAIVCGA